MTRASKPRAAAASAAARHTGAFLEMLSPLPRGKTVKLLMADPDSRERLTVRAQVVHKTVYGIGVRFLSFETSAREQHENQVLH